MASFLLRAPLAFTLGIDQLNTLKPTALEALARRTLEEKRAVNGNDAASAALSYIYRHCSKYTTSELRECLEKECDLSESAMQTVVDVAEQSRSNPECSTQGLRSLQWAIGISAESSRMSAPVQRGFVRLRINDSTLTLNLESVKRLHRQVRLTLESMHELD